MVYIKAENDVCHVEIQYFFYAPGDFCKHTNNWHSQNKGEKSASTIRTSAKIIGILIQQK
jgi:hypothetical protein